jgi:hypothetical protein
MGWAIDGGLILGGCIAGGGVVLGGVLLGGTEFGGTVPGGGLDCAMALSAAALSNSPDKAAARYLMWISFSR